MVGPVSPGSSPDQWPAARLRRAREVCAAKREYGYRWLAVNAAILLWLRDGRVLYPYLCPMSPARSAHWHLTHLVQPEKLALPEPSA